MDYRPRLTDDDVYQLRDALMAAICARTADITHALTDESARIAHAEVMGFLPLYVQFRALNGNRVKAEDRAHVLAAEANRALRARFDDK